MFILFKLAYAWSERQSENLYLNRLYFIFYFLNKTQKNVLKCVFIYTFIRTDRSRNTRKINIEK
jgi:hypothetical protein